jgi:hypothetical protein
VEKLLLKIQNKVNKSKKAIKIAKYNKYNILYFKNNTNK